MSDVVVKALLEHGLWGITVLILLFCVRHLYYRVQELHDKRLADMKTFADQFRAALEQNTKSIESWTRATLERRQ